MVNPILEEAKKIARHSKLVPLEQKEKYLEHAQEVIINYLYDHQHDIEGWLLLARLECNSPFYDHDRIADCVNHILLYDPFNAYSLLFWSYADYYLKGNLDQDLYNKLCMTHDENPKIMSMIELAKARFLKLKDSNKHEEALKKSIDYAPEFVTHFGMLGRFYIEQGNVMDGVDLIKRGLANIKTIVNSHESHFEIDPANIEQFLDEFFAGTIMSIVVFEQLEILLINNDIKSRI